jgi:hypothetical protein
MCPEPPQKNQDYRQEARKIRAAALQMNDAEAQAQLLLIASLYDKLADLSNKVPDLSNKLADLSEVPVPSPAKLSDNSRTEDPTEGTDAV